MNLKLMSCAALALTLSACGSDSSNNARSGVLIDSAVEGVSYQTNTQSGVTNSDGTFLFQAGETVTFSIGNIVFPSALAGAVVTPLTLAGSKDLTDPTVINIARLLQTLDSDQDPDNGISITTPAVTTELNFDLSVEAFEAQVLSSLGLTLISQADAVAHLEAELEALNNSGSGSGGGTTNPDTEAASVPAGLVGTYELKFSEENTGSGIADGSTASFSIDASGKLTLPDGTELTDPVTYKQNPYELIWVDTAADRSYAVTDAVEGELVDFNVANSKFYDQSGFVYYGQYRIFSETDLSAAQTLQALGGSYGSTVTYAVRNAGSVPTQAPTDVRTGDTTSLSIDAVTGVVTLYDYTFDPAAANFSFEEQLLRGGTTVYSLISTTAEQTNSLFLRVQADTLLQWDLTAKNSATSSSLTVSGDVTPYPAADLAFIDAVNALGATLTFVKDDPSKFNRIELCQTVGVSIANKASGNRPQLQLAFEGLGFVYPGSTYNPIYANYSEEGSTKSMNIGFDSRLELTGSTLTLLDDDEYTNDPAVISQACGK